MKEKCAIVTAATSGIGWASAVALAKAGAKVCIGAPVKDIETAANQLKEIQEQGLHIKAIAYDAFDTDSYKVLFDSSVAHMGGLDILVNNFGYTNPKVDVDIFHINPDDYMRIVNVNLASVIIPTQMALPLMAQRGGGSIVNIASIAGKVPDVTEMAYGTAKSAICHITKMIATQASPIKVRCNAVLPGMVMTPAVKQHLTDEYKQFFVRHVPLGRPAEPEEVADMVKFLAGNSAAMITGQLIDISGGFGTATPLYADAMEMAMKMS